MRTTRPAVCCRTRSQGVALFTVLWLIVLMSVLAVGAARVVRSETRILSTYLDRAEARAIAEAGVNMAILDLVASGESRRWRTDGTPGKFEFAGQRMLVSVRSTSGLVDLNSADERLLEGVLQLAGLDEDARVRLAVAVLDWRDGDDFARLHGAEANDYARAGLEWGPRNAAFQSVAELRYVYGMTAEVFRSVAPYLTVYSRRSGLELENAPSELVEVLTGRRITADEAPPAAAATGNLGTFHITVDVPISANAALELATVVQVSREPGHCCRTLARQERTKRVIEQEGVEPT